MKKLLIAGLVGSTLVGCASITGTTGQSVSIETLEKNGKSVAGASCELTNSKGKWFVNTPGTVAIRRSNDDMSILCKKDGLDPGLATVVSDTKGMMWGNILAGGGIGALVDHNTGAAYEYPVLIQIMMGSNIKIEPPKQKQDDSGSSAPSTQISTTTSTLVQSEKSSSSTIANKLVELNELKNKGLITQKDYDSKKAELLKSM
jgi:hypothetical protein